MKFIFLDRMNRIKFCLIFILGVCCVVATHSEQTTNTTAPTVTTTITNTVSEISPAAPPTHSEATNAEESTEPAPFPQTYVEPTKEEKKEAAKKPKRTGPPKTYGDCTGSYWIGQRIVAERHAGWGWLKPEGGSWKTAKWIMIEEKPGKIEAPSRFYNRPNDDHNMQYKLYGHFADYKGYEPNIDSLVEVFALKGFEVIGSSARIDRSPPGPSGGRKGRISERGAHF